MSGRESYGFVGVSVQKHAGVQSSEDSMSNMRLPFSADGTAVFKPTLTPTSSSPSPTPTYQTGIGGVGGDGSGVVAAQLSINPNTGEPTKRKRGRPRKYAPDGSMAAALTSPPQQAVQAGGFSSPTTAAPAAAAGAGASLSSGKKTRGRPPGSGRKQQVAAPGSSGVGFTPHVIAVKAGEDVFAKLMSFSQNKAQAVCILSANGAISNVTLRQAATSGGTVTCEGRFEILSLSGSFMPSESGGGQRSRTGGLSVSLAGPDGHVFGGGVAGLLTAASTVQVIVGTFIAGQQQSKSGHAEVLTASPKLVSGASAARSPPSRATLSESSGGPGSPLNQSTGAYNNSNPQGIANFAWR